MYFFVFFFIFLIFVAIFPKWICDINYKINKWIYGKLNNQGPLALNDIIKARCAFEMRFSKTRFRIWGVRISAIVSALFLLLFFLWIFYKIKTNV